MLLHTLKTVWLNILSKSFDFTSAQYRTIVEKRDMFELKTVLKRLCTYVYA